MERKDLKIAAMSVQYVQYSLAYMLDSFQKAGLHYIEFWGATPHFYAADYPTEEAVIERLAVIKDMMRQRGIEAVMYTPETLAYPFSYSHPDKLVRQRTIDYMVRNCHHAKALGCSQVFINTGCGLRDVPREESWARCRESFIELCDRTKDLGVNIVLEQLQPYESNLVLNLEDCKRMYDEVNSDHLGICLDVVAMEVAGDTVDEFFKVFEDKILHIHLADENHEILDDGTYPIESYIDDFVKHEFNGYISLEINDSIYWQDPHQSIQRSIDWLKEKQII